MVETAVREYLSYIKRTENDKKDLFDEPKKISLQVALSKIPNLVNDKTFLW